MFKSLSTRQRAISTSIILTILLFLFISPIALVVYEFISPPRDVKNIKVVAKNKEANISWDKNREGDLKSYMIVKDIDAPIELDAATNTYDLFNLDNGRQYNISVYALDNNGNASTSMNFVVTPSSEKTNSFIYNVYTAQDEVSNTIFIDSLVFVILLFIFNLWVLFFKLNKFTLFTVAAFPSFVMLPYLIVCLSILYSINTVSYRFIFAGGVAFGYLILSYLLLLTSNILNGAVYSQIPLEQAGKASQFIFSLISSYLILIYAFGSNQNIIIRVLLSGLFIFYFTFSSIWTSKNTTNYQVLIRTLSIVLLMILSVVLFSIWPIESVYAILAASVIYYILLNIALENRVKLNKTIWVEYCVLIILIVVLLLTNGNWGINGTLI